MLCVAAQARECPLCHSVFGYPQDSHQLQICFSSEAIVMTRWKFLNTKPPLRVDTKAAAPFYLDPADICSPPAADSPISVASSTQEVSQCLLAFPGVSTWTCSRDRKSVV